MASTYNNTNINEEVIDFSLKEFIQTCLRKWLWFLICLVGSVGIALFYIYTRQPVYERSEQILIEDQDSGGGVGDISEAFASLGLFSSNTNVNNELISLKSPAIMYEVVDSLQLDKNYTTRKGIRPQTLYGSNLPVNVYLLDVDPQGGCSFKFDINPDGSIKLYKFIEYVLGDKIKYKEEITLKPGETEVSSPLGRIRILPNPQYTGGLPTETMKINFGKMSMQATVELYSSKLKGDLVDQDADVIELSINDVSVQRAVDILNCVLAEYNRNWIEDKNKMAVATSAFIDDRLRVIQQELGDVDVSIANYMSKTGTPDLVASAEMSMKQESKLQEDIIELNNQIGVAEYMLDFVKNDRNNTSILPVNLGIENKDLASQIVIYNDLLLARNTIVSNSSEKNPLVANYDIQLSDLRGSIMGSIKNQIAGLQTSLNTLEREYKKVSGKMAGTSLEALPLLSEERQQKVKEELYLYLLQKREENELSQKFSADNTRIIHPPLGSLNPIAPKKGLIIIISIILGIGIPVIILYYIESTDTKIRGKKDLDTVIMPFAGEIPHVGKKTKLKVDTKKFRIDGKKDEAPPLAVVEEGKRDVVNEAFRVIRSNLDFMAGKNAGSQTIMLTSFNPGSGKSFITYNLALSFGLKGKKVLIIDCDLRHGSSSMYVGMPKKGITDYLTGAVDDWKSLIKTVVGHPLVNVMPIGKMPPNPAELLEESRLPELINEARKDYDIIFLDCPPVNIVVDTQIVGQYADRTLFVVRAGLLEKKALKELNQFYEEKKFKNMSLILNGTEAVHSRYYTYGNYQNLS